MVLPSEKPLESFTWGRKSSQTLSLLKETKVSLTAPHSVDERSALWGQAELRSGLREICNAGPLCPRWGPAVQLREAEMPVQPFICPDLSSSGAVQTEFAKRRLPPGRGAHLSLLEQGEPLPTRSRGLPVLLELPGMSRRRPERPELRAQVVCPSKSCLS